MTGSRLPAALAPERLRRRCDPSLFGFQTTDELEANEKIIGQERAVKAIRLGLEIPSPGFNVFVAGHAGTGRNTTIDRFLEAIPRDQQAPPDLAYVHNFREEDRPRLLTFPAGRGSPFRDAIDALVAGLVKTVPLVFASEEYALERKAVLEGYKEQQKELLKRFETQVEQEGFRLAQVHMGPIVRPSLVPVVQGEVVGFDQLEEAVGAGKLTRADAESIAKRSETLTEELEGVLKAVRGIDLEAEERVEHLDTDLIRPYVHDPLAALRRSHKTAAVDVYLEELEEDILAHLDRFRDGSEVPSLSGFPPPPSMPDPLLEYRVNLIVDNGPTRGAPIVNESSPTLRNLFGAIERTLDRSGEWKSHFTKIKAGSIPRANGGYLVLNASDVLSEGGVWTALKRMLRTGMVEIQVSESVVPFTTTALKPEPIPCQVKILMVGGHDLYGLLYGMDPEFSKIFKVKAEFDTVMDATREGILEYAGFIRKITRSEGLLAFDREGVAAIVEHGMRKAARVDRLSTKFTDIADVIREASWRASKEGAKHVLARHVVGAVAERRERRSLVESKVRETVDRGQLLIDVVGAQVGQVNGLAVHDVGDHAFGVPARITASLSMGRAGVVNIEREAEMSGPTHDKGVLILTGYLRSLFAQTRPLTLSASLCFEQSYGGVEGDSASSAEVYALLSALADVPIRQGLAVTGSVNQKGEVQPVGGINEKVEGWFAACKGRGLSGDQGVLIPSLNVDDLMLDAEIVEAVRAGRFAVYPVRHVSEGIELLTGIAAGERTAEGGFPEGSVHQRADSRLAELAERIRPFGPPGPHGD